jgi:putative Ca2+/H+ antiporter (TMEM165/GDT1 family)
LISLTVLATVFAVIFVGELPDKTAVAALVLGSRYRAVPVLLGISGAFAIHVTLAVALGGFVAALPARPIAIVTGLLFVIGAVLLLRSDPAEAVQAGEQNAASVVGALSDRRVAAGAFGVVLVAELGDLTQILTATLAARYDDPLSVGLGALLALWAVALLAVLFGRRLLTVVPLRRVQQVAAVVLLVLAAKSLWDAL